jgi:hypothetical protein
MNLDQIREYEQRLYHMASRGKYICQVEGCGNPQEPGQDFCEYHMNEMEQEQENWEFEQAAKRRGLPF